MSDARLEQRRREGHTVAALAERVRVGELSRSDLELAAYCGHEAARIVTTGDPRTGWALWTCLDYMLEPGDPYHEDRFQWWKFDKQPFGYWLRGLERWDGALLRAARAARNHLRTDPRLLTSEWKVALARREALHALRVCGVEEREVEAIQRAAELAGEERTREAIQTALAEWSLS